MRSTTTIPPKDKEEALESGTSQEVTHLLESHNDSDALFEVVVDHPWQPDLYEQCLQTIKILKQVDANIHHQPEYKSLSRKFYIYTIALIVLALSGIACPTITFAFLRKYLYQDYDSFIAAEQRKIDDLKLQMADAEKDTRLASDRYDSVFQKFYSYMSQYYQLWREPVGNDYCDWFAIDNPDVQNTPLYDYAKYIHGRDVFCKAANQGTEGNTLRCFNLATTGCAASLSNPEVTHALNSAYDEFHNAAYLQSQLNTAVNNEIDRMQSTTWLTRVQPLVMVPLLVTIMGISAIFLAAGLFRFSRSDYKTKTTPFFDLNHCMTDEAKQNALLLFLARVGVALIPETKPRDVIKELRNKAKVYKARREQRMAFLCGFHPGNGDTALHTFFAKADKNVLRLILQKADLLPLKPEGGL